MKKDNYTDHAALQAGLSGSEEFYTGSFTELPESTAEPKGKILGWHWEPLQETYSMAKKVMGAA